MSVRRIAKKKKPTPVWVRYRARWAYGEDHEWEYQEFDTSYTMTSIKQTLVDMAPAYTYDHEHFRGLTVEKIDAPPPEWLLGQIAEAHAMSASYMRRAEVLTELYDKVTN